MAGETQLVMELATSLSKAVLAIIDVYKIKIEEQKSEIVELNKTINQLKKAPK
jgi:hypothetical protein